MYSMIIAGFLIKDKISKIRFHKATIFLAETSMEIVLGMPFLVLNNTDIQFNTKSFT